MAGLSKLSPVYISCVDYVHPWQPNCTIAHAGLIVEAGLYSARTYTVVYVLSLLMRGRRPTRRDLLRTALGIVRSTAFLTTNSFTFCMFLCIIRHYAGHFNFYTLSFVPSLLGSLCAILIERPSRRGMLALYTANVASEAIFRMAVERRLVGPMSGGSVAVFGAGAAALMYVYRLSGGATDRAALKTTSDGSGSETKADSIFDVLRFVVGEEERRPIGAASADPRSPSDDDSAHIPNASTSSRRAAPSGSRRRVVVPLAIVQQAVAAYAQLLATIEARCPPHRTCPHSGGCVLYAARRAVRLFGVGLGLQVALKCVLQAGQVWRRGPRHLATQLCRRDTLRMGAFLGGFAGLYRGASCGLRHATDADRPAYAVPAALCASAAFAAYPDTTVALYAAWKAAQVVYGVAEERGWAPHVPHFDIVLYCLSTAMLFHVGIMEPLTLRPSYFKFLHSLSGARLVGMNRDCMQGYGLDTANKLAEAMRRTNITQRPSFAL